MEMNEIPLVNHQALTQRKTELFNQEQQALYRHTDDLFMRLLVFQWLAGILVALLISPKTWVGQQSEPHIHLWAALILGFAIISFPIFLVITRPGTTLTRHLIAVSQMLMGALLIHLMAGRLETHFHVFGSLAFLAFYRDWRVLVTASVVVALDHFIRGIVYPFSVYGVLTPEPWRWLEHAWWVVFENFFLIRSCLIGVKRAEHIAERQAQVETMNVLLEQKTTALTQSNQELHMEILERKQAETALKKTQDHLEDLVEARTTEAVRINEQLTRELEERKRLQGQLVQAQKMESIGQLAAGVAHEINNPVGFVMSNLGTLTDYTNTLREVIRIYETMISEAPNVRKSLETHELWLEMENLKQREDLPFILKDIDSLLLESREGTERVKEIVQSLKSFARLDEAQQKEANINECLENTLKIVWNELKYKCTVHKKLGDLPSVSCYPGQLNQVFMNLLVNAAQAIPERGEITIETAATEQNIIVQISDTGTGIPPEQLSHIFDPFFTTKPVGSGTGLGLSISYGIIQNHNGVIEVESKVGEGTCFKIQLPVKEVQHG